MNRNELTEKILTRYRDKIQEEKILNIISDYLNGNFSITEYEIDLVTKSVLQSVSDDVCYEYRLELKEDKEINVILTKALFMLLKEDAFEVYGIKNTIKGSHDPYKLCKEIGVPFYLYIIYTAKSMQSFRYYRYDDYIEKFFDNLKSYYGLYKNDFIEAYNNADDKDKLVLGVILYINKSDIPELKENVQSSLTDLFLNKIGCSELQVPNVMNYISGDDMCKDNAISEVKLVPNHRRDDFTLPLLLLYALKDFDSSYKRMMNLLSNVNIDECLKSIINISLGDEDFNGRIDKFKEILVHDLSIDESTFIIWCAINYSQTYGEDKKAIYDYLHEYAKINKEGFFDAVCKADGDEQMVFNRLKIQLLQGEPRLSAIKEAYISHMKKILEEVEFSSEEINDFELYINGEKELNKVLTNKSFKKQSYIWSGRIRPHIKPIVWFAKDTNLFPKMLHYVVHIGNGKLFDYFLNEFICENVGTFQEFMIMLSMECPNLEDVIYFISYNTVDGHHHGECYEVMKNWTRIMPLEVIKHIHLAPAEARITFLKLFKEIDYMKSNKEKYLELLCNLAGDSSKAVKEEALSTIKETLDSECKKSIATPLLSNKKGSEREAGVNILLTLPIEEVASILQDHLQIEKSSKIKNLIMDNLSTICEVAQEDVFVNTDDIELFCRENLNARKKSKLKWINLESLLPLILSNSNKVADKSTLEYILISFSDNKEIKINSEIKAIESNFTRESLSNIAYEILVSWCDNGALAKDKWILSFVGMYGDYNTVEYLGKKIRHWPEVSRTAIACEALKALAINGSSHALLFIDSIASKFKFNKVKTSASEALDFAASELEIDKEELCDKLVPSLDFDNEGKRVFDYGTRKFIAQLDENLNITIYNEDNKVLKSLPAVGKSDNEELATKSREEFKNLKKQLKDLIKNQSTRLDLALSINRTWTLSKWKDLFVENVIMQKFATGLIWGIYESGTLKNSFRYMEDGSFNSSDDEEVIIGDENLIGLVHPIDLSEEELENWKEQLEDYEITQPIIQLQRKIFLANSDNDFDSTFAGIKMSGAALNSKLVNRGWSTGSVRDGGWFNEFYKENHKLNIGAEIEFSGMGISYYDEEDPTIFYLRFYVAGTVERGSYVYDSIKKNNIIKPMDVSKRLYSEILYDLSIATEKNLGIDSDWEKDLKDYTNYRDK